MKNLGESLFSGDGRLLRACRQIWKETLTLAAITISYTHVRRGFSDNIIRDGVE